MASNVTIDTSSFDAGIKKLDAIVESKSQDGLFAIATEVGRLSSHEVPHDTGMLQNSYGIEIGVDEVVAGYNKEYAAYQHEGVRADGSRQITSYQKGRKGKYLEDPIKYNLNALLSFYQKIVSQIFS